MPFIPLPIANSSPHQNRLHYPTLPQKPGTYEACMSTSISVRDSAHLSCAKPAHLFLREKKFKSLLTARLAGRKHPVRQASCMPSVGEEGCFAAAPQPWIQRRSRG